MPIIAVTANAFDEDADEARAVRHGRASRRNRTRARSFAS